MTRGDDLRIADIRAAGRTIATLVARGRGAFDSDPAIQPALERFLEIIGEAAGALQEETRQSYPTVPWREIMRLRTVLAHHYHRVVPDQVWTSAQQDVPKVLEALAQPEEGQGRRGGA